MNMKMNDYSRMKKQDLINELTKRDNTIEKHGELLKRAAHEINALELSLASSRMFLGYLTKLQLDQAECTEVYVNKQEAFELLQTHYVDFTEVVESEELNGAILRLLPQPIPTEPAEEQEVDLENANQLTQ